MQLVDVKTISSIINRSNDLIITTHINPDGDAIGSSVALAYYLRDMNKNVRIINYSPTPWNLQFMDPDSLIELYDSNKHDEDLLNAELVCVLDLNDSKRLKEIGEVLDQRSNRTIVIDHHLNPKEFANEYWIDTNSASTGEMIYRIIKEVGSDYSKISADAIYVAIITDTGNFRYDRVSPETHFIAADLLEHGAKSDFLYEMVYNRNTQSALNLLGDALRSIQTFNEGKLSVMTISNKMFEDNNAKEDDVEGFAQQTLRIDGVEAGITITEIKERSELRCSFRSKGRISVRELAEVFGGGGHAFAAGARIKTDDLETTRREIIEKASLIFK